MIAQPPEWGNAKDGSTVHLSEVEIAARRHTLTVLRKMRDTIENIRIEGYNSLHDFTHTVDEAIRNEEKA